MTLTCSSLCLWGNTFYCHIHFISIYLATVLYASNLLYIHKQVSTDINKTAPVRMFESVGSSQVSSEVVSQQHHFLQSHLFPPLLQRPQELLLSHLRVGAELGAAAPAETQQVQSVDWAIARERVQVLGPEGNSAPDTVQENQRRPGRDRGLGARWRGRLQMSRECYCPQRVVVGYGDMLPGERPAHTCRRGGEMMGQAMEVLYEMKTLMRVQSLMKTLKRVHSNALSYPPPEWGAHPGRRYCRTTCRTCRFKNNIVPTAVVFFWWF